MELLRSCFYAQSVIAIVTLKTVMMSCLWWPLLPRQRVLGSQGRIFSCQCSPDANGAGLTPQVKNGLPTSPRALLRAFLTRGGQTPEAGLEVKLLTAFAGIGGGGFGVPLDPGGVLQLGNPGGGEAAAGRVQLCAPELGCAGGNRRGPGRDRGNRRGPGGTGEG